jgi:hypothetical protein
VADHTSRRPARQMRLVELVAAAQRRWGVRALVQSVERMVEPGALPTGIAPLDILLDGGLPRGRLTEFLGTPTSGMTTIALQALAPTQASGEIGAYLDMRGTFDGAYAAACGVDLPALLLVRPRGLDDALELTEALLTSGGIGLLVIDALTIVRRVNDAAPLQGALQRLLPAMAPHPGALLVLTPLRPARLLASAPDLASPFAHAAALRLHVVRQAWEPGAAAPKCSARLTVVKRRGGADGHAVELPITFPEYQERL